MNGKIAPGTRAVFTPKGAYRRLYAQTWMGSTHPDGLVECTVERTDVEVWGTSWHNKDGNPCDLNFGITTGSDMLVVADPAYFVRTANDLSHLADASELEVIQP